jgi:uncharacterized protein
VRRAVIDTNVWVSALLNRRGFPARIPDALEVGRFTLVISAALLDELAEVLARPRIVRKYGVTRTEIDQLVGLLRSRGTEVAVTGHLQLCRDPDDDIVLETALLGSCDAVVSRDEDLKGDADLVQVLRETGIEVLSVQQFLDALGRESP